jgi:hypothetical protein
MKTSIEKIAAHILTVHSLFSVIVFTACMVYGIILLFGFMPALVLPAIPTAVLGIFVVCFGGFYLTGVWRNQPEPKSEGSASRSKYYYNIIGVLTVVGIIVGHAFVGIVLYRYIGADHALYQKVLFVSATLNVIVMTTISVRNMIMSK